MSVYVDDAFIPYGRMRMSHMIADSPAELREMAERIGVPRRHVQYPGTTREHFDVCKEKRQAAIAAGAKPVSTRQLVGVLRAREGGSATTLREAAENDAVALCCYGYWPAGSL